MQNLLEQAREALGPAPRTFSPWLSLTYLRVPKPRWLTPRDGLVDFFRGREQLLREGNVVWGHLIQANSKLFRPGKKDHPGEVVYPLNPNREVHLEELAEIAQRLFQLKGTSPSDRELAGLAKYLTNERIRVFGLRVPREVAPRTRCGISTVFFRRPHLPDRMLSCSFFPLVVSRQDPRLAAVVPSRYWPQELIESWMFQGNLRRRFM